MVNQYSKTNLPKIVRLTRDEFELDNGQVFPHLEPFEGDVTLSEFEKSYQELYKYILDIMGNLPDEIADVMNDTDK